MGDDASAGGGAPATGQDAESVPYPPERYAWYVVFVLMVVYIFSFIDRQILALLVEPIKRDLDVSDTYMSYLMGTSFAVFYTILGLPMGRLADSYSRRGIIAGGLVVWSMMSAGCGLARTYAHLVFLRVGVGVGEATLSPSAYSLITDYFRPNRLALALSVYGMGIYMGSGLAFLFGGLVVEFAGDRGATTVPLLGEIRPWQFVFFAIGLPGILFAIALTTVKEPVRRGLLRAGAFDAEGSLKRSVPISEVKQYIFDNKWTFVCHNLGIALISFSAYGGAQWVPSYFIRVHDWSQRDIGVSYGIAVMLLGTTGIVLGGMLANWLSRRGHRDAKLRAALIAGAIHIPVALFPLIPNPYVSFAVLGLSILTLAMPFGVAPAAIQEMMPNRMRGQASAIYLFVINLIGLGLGPSAVAWCTDYLFQAEEKVGWSLALVGTVAGIISVALLWVGCGCFRRSLDYYEQWQARQA